MPLFGGVIIIIYENNDLNVILIIGLNHKCLSCQVVYQIGGGHLKMIMKVNHMIETSFLYFFFIAKHIKKYKKLSA